MIGWIKFAIRRLNFARRLKRICEKQQYRLVTDRRLWMFGKNGSGKCNFIIDCGNARLAVKLIGFRSKKIFFRFWKEDYYLTRNLSHKTVVTSMFEQYELRQKEPYKFGEGNSAFIVMVPESMKVSVKVNNRRREVGNGDCVPEGRFYFGGKFLEIISKKR